MAGKSRVLVFEAQKFNLSPLVSEIGYHQPSFFYAHNLFLQKEISSHSVLIHERT